VCVVSVRLIDDFGVKTELEHPRNVACARQMCRNLLAAPRHAYTFLLPSAPPSCKFCLPQMSNGCVWVKLNIQLYLGIQSVCICFSHRFSTLPQSISLCLFVCLSVTSLFSRCLMLRIRSVFRSKAGGDKLAGKYFDYIISTMGLNGLNTEH